MAVIKRTEEEINEVRNWAADAMDTGSRYPGMSYEEGIEAMAAWMLGDIDDRPDAD